MMSIVAIARGEVVLGGFQLGRVFLRLVAQRGEILVAEHRIAVEADLGVEHHQLVVVRHGERVDLDLRGVSAEEGIIDLRGELLGLLGEIARQPQRVGDGAAVMRHEAGRGIDVEGVDLLGRVMRDRLDVHAALGGDDEGDAAGGAIDQHREVEFLGDVHAVGDVEAVDLLAVLAGLHRDERVAEHIGGGGAHFLDALGQAHAALGVGRQFLELALAAAAGVDLRLDDIKRPGQLLRRLARLVDGHRGIAGRDGDAELREQFLGLIFMDVHGMRGLTI